MKTKTDESPLKIVVVGHVDHGKSSIIGRLFYETGGLPEGKFEEIQKMCEVRGMPFEWSFLMDSLQEERNQGITIDTTQIWFKTELRKYVIIDAPGHKEFIKNMVTGAASSDAALLIIDAKEGIREQTQRHGYLLKLLGIKQTIVIVNKMDLVDYSENVFKKLKQEFLEVSKSLGLSLNLFLPLSAKQGDGVTKFGESLSWYQGPNLVEALDGLNAGGTLDDRPLRFPVQDIYKFDDRRIVAGRIESGSIKKGDEVIILPTGKKTVIETVEGGKGERAISEMSVGLVLRDPHFVQRGDVIVHKENYPPLSHEFITQIFWLGNKPLKEGKTYKAKINTNEFKVQVKKVYHGVDPDGSEEFECDEIEKFFIGKVSFTSFKTLPIDTFHENPSTGRFVLLEEFDIVGGGQILKVENEQSNFLSHSAVNREKRNSFNNHFSGVLWMTGLSGAGKTTLAKKLENYLFQKGYQVVVLDGDELRKGISQNLGFSSEDRLENIRRVSHLASFLAKSGFITIVSLISPLKLGRERARAICTPFYEIYVKSSLQSREERDIKGLYKKARMGEISDFTGVNSPYEEPENPELTIETEHLTPEESLSRLEEFVEEKFVDPLKKVSIGHYQI